MTRNAAPLPVEPDTTLIWLLWEALDGRRV